MACQSVNPNTGKVLQSFEHLNNTQLDATLAAAEHCFHSWKQTSFGERAVIVNKAAALLHAHVDDFAKLETLDVGKRIGTTSVPTTSTNWTRVSTWMRSATARSAWTRPPLLRCGPCSRARVTSTSPSPATPTTTATASSRPHKA